MHISPDLKLRTLEDALWKTALDSVRPLEIQPACELLLRAWITVGVQRMERQRRTTPGDLAVARSNLKVFIDLLKREAVFLGKPDRLDNATFRAARERLRWQPSLTTLWPFWPYHFVATN
jgi:hypothetical protein